MDKKHTDDVVLDYEDSADQDESGVGISHEADYTHAGDNTPVTQTV